MDISERDAKMLAVYPFDNIKRMLLRVIIFPVDECRYGCEYGVYVNKN